jgi:hypothetical protein
MYGVSVKEGQELKDTDVTENAFASTILFYQSQTSTDPWPHCNTESEQSPLFTLRKVWYNIPTYKKINIDENSASSASCHSSTLGSLRSLRLFAIEPYLQ